MKTLLKNQKIVILATALFLLTIIGAKASPLPQSTLQKYDFSVFKVKVTQPQVQVEVSATGKTQAKTISSFAQKKATAMAPRLTYVTPQSSSKKSSKTYKKSSKKVVSVSSEQARARRILAKYIARYPILKGTQIYVRQCPYNWQGCAYYKKGVILIDPDHTAPLEKIIAHEVRHIIDWREDHKIDYNDYHK